MIHTPDKRQDLIKQPNDERVILLEVTVKAAPGTMQATKIAAGLSALLPDGSDVRVADPSDFTSAPSLNTEELEKQITDIIKAPMRSEISTSDIVVGMMSSTGLSEKVHNLANLLAQHTQVAVKSAIAEQNLKEICWEQESGRLLACDRMKDHKGLHSWELEQRKSNVNNKKAK